VEKAPAIVDITSVDRRRPRRGVALHRASLPPADLRLVRGIVVTSVPRTLLDLASTVSDQRLRRLVKEAEFQRLTGTDELRDVLARHTRRKSRGTLARIVGDRVHAGRPTRSEMEDLFLEFCARRGLALPETNVELMIRGRKLEVDCVWRAERVALELDSRQAHDTEAQSSATGGDLRTGWVRK